MEFVERTAARQSRQPVCAICRATNARHHESSQNWKSRRCFLAGWSPWGNDNDGRKERRANEKFCELFPMISRRDRDIELKSNNAGSFCQRARVRSCQRRHRRQKHVAGYFIISSIYETAATSKKRDALEGNAVRKFAVMRISRFPSKRGESPLINERNSVDAIDSWNSQLALDKSENRKKD